MSSANTSYKLMQALDPDIETIGPIQMGLNKSIHFHRLRGQRARCGQRDRYCRSSTPT
jgi:phosphotransacetylase